MIFIFPCVNFSACVFIGLCISAGFYLTCDQASLFSSRSVKGTPDRRLVSMQTNYFYRDA